MAPYSGFTYVSFKNVFVTWMRLQYRGTQNIQFTQSYKNKNRLFLKERAVLLLNLKILINGDRQTNTTMR